MNEPIGNSEQLPKPFMTIIDAPHSVWKVGFDCHGNDLSKHIGTHLYTHPMRELSNQEMIEPVAWMFEYGTDRGDATNPISWHTNIKFQKPYSVGLIRKIKPLYTHPMRELTDEEIAHVLDKFISDGGSIFDAGGWTKAILKKASEK